MPSDPFNTPIEFVLPTMQPIEFLAKRRKEFLVIRWLVRIGLGCLIITMSTLLGWRLIDGELLEEWNAIPLLFIIFFLIMAIENVRFCPDCHAQFGLPIWRWRTPAFCTNCGRVLDAKKVVIDPPGIVNLSDERYRDESEPIVKLISMVILLGIKDRSTEIRFEPGQEDYRLSYRCAGIFYDMVPPPRHLERTISGTLKAMTGLGHERRPQIGTLQIMVEGSSIDARVEIQPTEFGENVIIVLPEFKDAPAKVEKVIGRYLRKLDSENA